MEEWRKAEKRRSGEKQRSGGVEEWRSGGVEECDGVQSVMEFWIDHGELSLRQKVQNIIVRSLEIARVQNLKYRLRFLVDFQTGV